MASISVYNIDSTSFSVMLTELQTDGVTYIRKCSWTAYENSSGNYIGSGNSYIEPGNTEGGDFTFTGMSPNTEYVVSCQVYRTDTGVWLASISSDVITTNSSDSGGDSGGGDIEPVWSYELGDFVVDDYFEQTIYIPQYTTLIYSISFENDGIFKFYTSGDYVTSGFLCNRRRFDETTGHPLALYGVMNRDYDGYDNFYFAHKVYADTTYYLFVKHYDGESEGRVTLHIEPYDGLIIDRWNWSGTIRKTAYDAVMNQGATTNFDHQVWDDLVDKVYEVVDVCGYVWDDSYADYDNTKSIPNSKGEYVLTSDMFNALRNNIEIIGRYYIGTDTIDDTTDHDNATRGTIPHPVMSGKPVFGHYFNTITAYINLCIDLLTDYGVEQ